MKYEPLPLVVAARYLGGHRFHLRFDDGVQGDVDLRDVLGDYPGSLAEPLRVAGYVAKARVEGGTLVWPNGMDVGEEVLYCAATGQPEPGPEPRSTSSPSTEGGRRSVRPRRKTKTAAKGRPKARRATGR